MVCIRRGEYSHKYANLRKLFPSTAILYEKNTIYYFSASIFTSIVLYLDVPLDME